MGKPKLLHPKQACHDQLVLDFGEDVKFVSVDCSYLGSIAVNISDPLHVDDAIVAKVELLKTHKYPKKKVCVSVCLCTKRRERERRIGKEKERKREERGQMGASATGRRTLEREVFLLCWGWSTVQAHCFCETTNNMVVCHATGHDCDQSEMHLRLYACVCVFG